MYPTLSYPMKLSRAEGVAEKNRVYIVAMRPTTYDFGLFLTSRIHSADAQIRIFFRPAAGGILTVTK